jgi:hypothetical protein
VSQAIHEEFGAEVELRGRYRRKENGNGGGERRQPHDVEATPNLPFYPASANGGE